MGSIGHIPPFIEQEKPVKAAPHVLVIGAGITGALIAQGLKQAGVRCTVFDDELSAGSGRFREWTLAVHWSLPLLRKLLPENLNQRLPEAQCDPTHNDDEKVQIYNSNTNELLKEVQVNGMKRVSRRKLRTLCIDGISILWGKTLAHVTYCENETGVIAHFSDGSNYSGDIIIGADGPKSKIRETLFGVEKAKSKPVGVVQNTTLVKYKDAAKSLHIRSGNPLFYLGYNPDGIVNFVSIQDIPDPAHPEDWTFITGTSWLGERDATQDNAARLKELKERAKNFAEPFRSASLWIEEGTPTFHDQVQYWVPSRWDNRGGMITLAGDAAHPMPPHRGQGLNHAVCDASNLVNAITSIKNRIVSRADAISAYDAEMVKRGAAEVNLSVQNALMVHDWKLVMDSPAMKHGIKKMS